MDTYQETRDESREVIVTSDDGGITPTRCDC